VNPAQDFDGDWNNISSFFTFPFSFINLRKASASKIIFIKENGNVKKLEMLFQSPSKS